VVSWAAVLPEDAIALETHMRKRVGVFAAWGLAAFLCVAAHVSAEPRAPGAGDGPLVLDVLEAGTRVVPHGAPFVVWATNQAPKTIVSYGLVVSRRDHQARPQPLRRHVVRPRQGLAPGQRGQVPVRVEGPSPEYVLQCTFVLFEDGTWAGDADAARQEIASLREEYGAVRAIGADLAGMPQRPDRASLVTLARQLSQGLARASTHGARQQYEACLDTIARVLDERTRAGRTYEEALVITRVRVDRVLGRLEQYSFVAASQFKG
jgi:hypothetical protein